MKKENGITLIALVITIIVMLILVGVSVTVALKGGLFTTAKQAKENTALERDKELNLSEGKVEINGEWYNSIDEYVNGGGSNEPTEPEKPTNPSEPTEPENPTDPSEQGTITPKKETYTIGEEVTIGEESFYVIADDTDKVTLLAKDCIDTSTLVQDASAGTVAFSSTNYWSSETEYPLDLNNYTIPADATSITTTAKTYGANLGGTGRLMTKEEADALKTEAYSDILYGTNGKSSGTYLNYWLGSADGGSGVWMVHGSYSAGGGWDFDDARVYGVRPVVEILKSNI